MGTAVASLTYKLVVLAVSSYPEPLNAALDVNTKCAVVKTYTHRPERPDALEVQRRMLWVFLE